MSLENFSMENVVATVAHDLGPRILAAGYAVYWKRIDAVQTEYASDGDGVSGVAGVLGLRQGAREHGLGAR